MAINTNRRPSLLKPRGTGVVAQPRPKVGVRRPPRQEEPDPTRGRPLPPNVTPGVASVAPASSPAAPAPDKKDALKAAKQKAAGDDVSELAALKRQHAKEKAAALTEQRTTRQKALADAGARAGLGGFGLSGATSAIQGDIGSQMVRRDVLANADLAEQQRDEEFEFLQDQIALTDFEIADDRDHDGDGFIGGDPVGGLVGDGDPENNPEAPGSPGDVGDAREAAARLTFEGTGSQDDPFSAPLEGGLPVDTLEGLVAGGVEFTVVRVETGLFNREKYIIATDGDGKFYKFRMPDVGVGDWDNDEDAIAWFEGVAGGGA